MLRLRPLTPQQAEFLEGAAKEQKTSEQKEAMLYVLRELTGKKDNLGHTSKDWWPVLPPHLRPKEVPAETVTITGKDDWKQFLPTGKATLSREALEARRLEQQLINGPVENQSSLIEKLKSGSSIAHTEALARAIPRLKGTALDKARTALTSRLTALPGTALAERLQDGLVEIRRAAALACGEKNDKNQIPGLIALLEDREGEVVQAARRALSRLTKVDFGPKPEDSPEARGRALKAWSSWWNEQLSR